MSTHPCLHKGAHPQDKYITSVYYSVYYYVYVLSFLELLKVAITFSDIMVTESITYMI